MAVEDLLEGHLAVQLGVEGHEDGAQAALGVGPEDAEPLAVGGGRADGVAGGAVGVAVGVGRAEAEPTWARVASRSGSPSRGQALAGGAAGGDGGQALLGVAAVLLEVAGHQGLDGGSVVGVEVAAADEVVGQGAGLVERPGLEGGDELALVDQAVLQGQQAEEQVAVGGEGGHGEAPGREPPPTRPAAAPEPGGGGRRIGRIIAHGSVASRPAGPVPIAPGGVRLLGRSRSPDSLVRTAHRPNAKSPLK